MNRKQRRLAAKGAAGAPAPAAGATSFADAARRLHEEGRLLDARDAYREAVRAEPRNLDVVMNLGVVLGQLGCQEEAPRFIRQGLQLAPTNPAVHTNAGILFAQLGRWDDARAVLERAIALDPRVQASYENLAYVLLENGEREKAVQALARAIALDPNAAGPYFRLHTALYDDRDLAPATKALTEAVARAPANAFYRLLFGVLLDMTGDAKGARQQFAEVNRDGTHGGAIESWEYVKRKRTPATRFFGTTRETLRYGVAQAQDGTSPASPRRGQHQGPGLVLELGVRFGISTRWIAAAVGAETKVHGFDSFQGLPETWHIQAAGTYSTRGELPEVPANVELHVGLFDATLPGFLAKEPERTVRFMNVDCDLYSSTKVALDLVGARVVPGTVIVFDEYIVNDRWAEDEFKAFQEAVKERGWGYEYLAFSVQNGQAVVRIT
jgi:Flp pilus assembly protein TadD